MAEIITFVAGCVVGWFANLYRVRILRVRDGIKAVVEREME